MTKSAVDTKKCRETEGGLFPGGDEGSFLTEVGLDVLYGLNAFHKLLHKCLIHILSHDGEEIFSVCPEPMVGGMFGCIRVIKFYEHGQDFVVPYDQTLRNGFRVPFTGVLDSVLIDLRNPFGEVLGEHDLRFIYEPFSIGVGGIFRYPIREELVKVECIFLRFRKGLVVMVPFLDFFLA